jgi:hypothetical protein
MFDYLVNNTIKYVWCNPEQDLQSIVEPAKLTPRGGVWNTVDVCWRTHKLPEANKRFHVYQIGQLHPALMGLFPMAGKWITFAEACVRESLIVDIYSDAGIQLPRSECWYMVTADRNLIMAVKDQPKIPFDLKDEKLFIRVYSNAFFNSVRSDSQYDGVVVYGKTVVSTGEILDIQNKFNISKAKPIGHTYAFVNGVKVSTLDLFTVQADDVVEFVYDSSIARVITIPLNSLETFVSTLDNQHKYLVHYPTSDKYTTYFHDDVDFFLTKPYLSTRDQGLFINKNNQNAVRMVTHRDYALSLPHLQGIIHQHEGWETATDLSLVLHVRRSGYIRNLGFENNRILELYKLGDADIIKAMLGVDSTVNVWKAMNLEASAYANMLRMQLKNVTRQVVQDALGYNALSVLLGNTPNKTTLSSSRQVADVPFSLYQKATVYEYGDDGKFLGRYQHGLSTTYAAANNTCAMVEMLSGTGTDLLSENYGIKEQVVNPNLDYRFYVCDIEGGVPNNKWKDVTGGPEYVIIDNRLTWLVDITRFYTLVRSDANFLAYGISLKPTDGLLNFTLTHRQKRAGVISNWLMQVPMGELDIFLNDSPLVEGVDYLVNFPEISIINKEYLINPLTTAQRIEIRFTGFCNKDFSRDVFTDIGFVDHGYLSNNNKFDIRDDKVLRIVVGGKLVSRDTLVFSEDHSGISVPNPAITNGKPYAIRDMIIPFGDKTVDNAYALRKLSRVIDKEISDYLTIKVPGPTFTTPNVIPARYQVFSPFCCKVIYDLKAGLIDRDLLTGFYSDDMVRKACKIYEPLLKLDPTQELMKVDDRYVEIHPHNLLTVIDLDAHAYKFLTRVIKIYLKDKVNISHFIRLLA